MKDEYTRTINTSLTSFHRLSKQSPFFSKFYPIYKEEQKHPKPLLGYVYNFSINQIHQYNVDQKKNNDYTRQILSLNRFINFFETYFIQSNTQKYMFDIISLHVYNNYSYKITLSLGLLKYSETNATISPTKKNSIEIK